MIEAHMQSLTGNSLPNDILHRIAWLALLVLLVMGVVQGSFFLISTLVVTGVVVWSMLDPVAGIFWVVLLTPFESIHQADFYVCKCVKLAILGIVMLRLYLDRSKDNRPDPYRRVIYLLLIPAFVSTMLAASPLHSALGLLQLVAFWAYYMLVRRTELSLKTAEHIFNFLLALSMPIAALALLQSFYGYGVLGSHEQQLDAAKGSVDTYWPSLQRASATFASCNSAGTFFGVAALVALLHGLLIPYRRWRYLFVALAAGFALLITFSRGAVLGFCGGLLFWTFATGDRRLRWIVISAIAGSLMLVFLLVPQSQLVGYVRVGDDIASASITRVHAWQSAWQIIQEHPLHGIGFYEFQARAADLEDVSDAPQHPHNGVLKAIVEDGVVGGIAYLWYLGVFLKTSISSMRQHAQRTNYVWIFASIGAVGVCLFTQELVDAGDTMGGSSIAILFATLLALQTRFLSPADDPA